MTGQRQSDEYLLSAWKHHEDIAMHFNDLILKVRTQALGALAAFIAVGGVALKVLESKDVAIPWGLVASLSGIFFAFWIAIWTLDFMYYNRLLMGAVNAILKLEDDMNTNAGPVDITLSHSIEAAVRENRYTHLARGTLSGPWWFYSIVTVVLFGSFVYSLFHMLCGWHAV